MTRFKSHKDYAIKMVHPEFGDFYFSYADTYANLYIFTKNLKRVCKWKTKNSILSKINEIIESTHRSRILLSFGKDVNDSFKNRILIDKNMTVSMKRYYYRVRNVSTSVFIKEAQINIDAISKTLVPDVESIRQAIINNAVDEKKFMDKLQEFIKDINEYRKNYSIIKKYTRNTEGLAFIDIVDASYGFRNLKLKTLKNVNEPEMD
jgi:hypothetical protein